MNILICENENAVAFALNFYLHKNGHVVTLVKNGESALSEINTNSYDLIITDLFITFHTGFELLHHLRTVLKKNTPVIILTKLNDENEKQEILKMGADDFITKPFNPVDLINKVNELLYKTPKKNIKTYVQMIDREQLEQITEGDKDYMNEILKHFIDITNDTLSIIRQNLQEINCKGLLEQCEKLSRQLTFLGIYTANAITEQMVSIISSKKDMKRIPSLVIELEIQCKKAITEAKKMI
ncbi:MAG: response regulator transcription factor [Bacteroidota bacterium]